ncbi:MAG: hypothetical protein ABI682_07010 [Acidobacteriota bacterium]
MRSRVLFRSLALWLGLAIVLGGAQWFASHDRRPLDDPDLAFQRPGFLDAHGPPFPAPPVAPGLPKLGERFILFFVREEQATALHDALMNRTHPFDTVSMAIAFVGPKPGHQDVVAPFLDDAGGEIAASYRMRRPRDGGPPVGYAIVDSTGFVRYRTLDPTVWKRLDEVQTMWVATP